jgi:hypothetical protein
MQIGLLFCKRFRNFIASLEIEHNMSLPQFKNQSLPEKAAWLFILVISICAAVMFYVTFPQADDFEYYSHSREFLASLNLPFHMPDSSDIFRDAYCETNGRFTTLIYIYALLLLPHWLLSITNGIATFALLSLIYKLANFSTYGNQRRQIPPKYNALSILLIGVLSLVSLPWNDSMFLFAFSINYIYHSALLLFATYLFLRIAFTNANYSVAKLSLICLLMLLCGGCHEGNACAVFGGLFITLFAAPKAKRKTLAIMLGLMVIGILTIVLSPGIASRASGAGVGLNPANWFQSKTLTGGYYLLPQHVFPLLTLAVSAAVAIAKREQIVALAKRLFSKQIFYALTDLPLWANVVLLSEVIVVANLFLALFVASPRASAMENIFSIIAVMTMLLRWLPQLKSKLIFRISATIATLLAIILTINIAICIRVQRYITNDQLTIMKLLEESSDGEVYYDPIDWPTVSKYPWQWYLNYNYTDCIPYYHLHLHPNLSFQKPLRLLPTALQDIPDADSIHGITLYKGNFISDSEPQLPAGEERNDLFPEYLPFMKINAKVLTTSGKQETRFYFIVPFNSSGRTLYYFRPAGCDFTKLHDPATAILSISTSKYW